MINDLRFEKLATRDFQSKRELDKKKLKNENKL